MTTPVMETSHPSRSRRSTLRAGAIDAVVVAGWFVVAGLLGAVVWWQVTTLPKLTRTGDSAAQAPDQLVGQVGIDTWFLVVALVGGLVSGIVLLALRRRDPLLMVVLVVLGGGLASWLMINLGLALGPEKEVVALRSAPDGATVLLQLKLHAPGMAYIWSIGAALGALVSVWVLAKPGADRAD